MKTKVVVVLVGLVVLAGFFWWQQARDNINAFPDENGQNTAQVEQLSPSSSAHPAPEPDVIIIFTPDGYEPNEVTVQKGDTVQFRSTREGFYWPASDVHPTHEEYSEFDPQRPLATDETWSFTFDQTGSWDFHDHLYSRYTGVITVTE